MLYEVDQLQPLCHLAVTMFADPESYTPGSMGSSIANSAANFESIWDVADNSGFGISGLVKRWSISPLPGEQANIRRNWLALNAVEDFDEEVSDRPEYIYKRQRLNPFFLVPYSYMRCSRTRLDFITFTRTPRIK